MWNIRISKRLQLLFLILGNHKIDLNIFLIIPYWEPIGIPRTFRIKPRSGGSDRLDIPLDHGLLVVMGGDMQSNYKHGVPAIKKETGRRINVTLRQFQ